MAVVNFIFAVGIRSLRFEVGESGCCLLKC
jgi:hypothetical protein